MSDGRELLERLLAGTLPDPDGGTVLAVPTARVCIAATLAGAERDCVTSLGLGDHLAVVSDPVTREVLGRRVERALAGTASVRPVVLPAPVHADQRTAASLVRASSRCDALVAVGSGTINDLCKYAAATQDKPYCVFATAPSMNGYTSQNAAITVAGLKRSLAARAARGVFMDLGVLARAPVAMIRAGLGDSLCRSTAQADWLLAHLLLDHPYREMPFALLAPDEEALIAEARALTGGDLAAMERLARTLVLSGFGMSLCGASHPASQGEHLVAHYLEMMHPTRSQRLHGEQIGVTTLTMSRLQRSLLDGPRPVVRPGGPELAQLQAHYGMELGTACWQEFRAKRMEPGRCARLAARIEARWEEVRSRLGAISRPTHELEAALAAAGAPRRPAELGWPSARYAEALARAREIRNRYTALDLAADSDRLGAFIEAEGQRAP